MTVAGTDRPAPPAALADEHAAGLDGLVEQALRAQRRNVAAGLDGALERVPRILRGPIRRVAGG